MTHWTLKPQLAASRPTWREFSSRQAVLSWVEGAKPRGLYLYHSRWPIFDFDGGPGDQALVVQAARKVFQAAGFREGEDFRVVATGGKGVRVTWCYLFPSQEDVALLRERIARLAEEVHVLAPRAPRIVRESWEKLAEVKKELAETSALLDASWARRDWGAIKRLKSKVASLQAEATRLQKRASAWDSRKKRVRASVFLDPAVGARSHPERICGWDEVHGKWGRPLPPGKVIASPEEYKKFCRPPRDMVWAVLEYARELLPRETEKVPAHIEKILEGERRRRDLLRKGKRGEKKFNWIFSLLNEKVEDVLKILERAVWKEDVQAQISRDAEDLALSAFSFHFPLKDKGEIKEVKGPCPGCGGGNKAKRGTAFLFRRGGRWYIKCHRTSCPLNSPRPLLPFCLEEGIVSPADLPEPPRKRKIERKAGLGTYLSPKFRQVSPGEAAEEVLAELSQDRAVLVSWRLGAGKTTFAALLARAWGEESMGAISFVGAGRAISRSLARFRGSCEEITV